MDKNLGEGAASSGGIVGAIKWELEKRKREPRTIVFDALVFTMTFLFSRFHLIWGAYPLAVSFIAATPVGVWVALIGALVGAISLGKSGIIHAMIALIVVFLRIVISGGESKKEDGRAVFSEPLLLRISASVIGAFIGAVYELLLGGLSSASILYSLASCLFGALFTFVFWGLFEAKISFEDIVFGKEAVFERKRQGRDKYNWFLFQGSFLVLLFFISLAAASYTVLGIDLAFVFAGFVTLFAAKRFGAVRAMAIGFVASFGVSGTYSVSFALLGLGAGFFFPVAPVYAFLAGGALLSAWSAYSGGLVGFLSTFPEFACAVALFFPFLKSLPGERKEEVREDSRRIASDMVGSMALSHRNERGGGIDRLTSSVASLSGVVRRFGKGEETLTREEISDCLISTAREACLVCPNFSVCLELNPAPCAEIIDELSTKIYKDGKLSSRDIKLLPEYCESGEYLIERLASSYGLLFRTKYKSRNLGELAEEYELVSKMINEARLAEEREWSVDSALSDKLNKALLDVGLSDGVVKAFGDRKKRFIVAGEDKAGDIISSGELREGIEKISGLKLGVPEFFRKGDIALMDCLAAPSYYVEYAESSATAPASDVSGDTAVSFISDDGYFYSLLSDGMGSGETAKSASFFVYEFLKAMLSASVSDNTALHILNHIIRRKTEECSATLDLFRFDLLRGEAIFVKSGASASYVKRESSLFRIRSETVPLGLMKSIDSERIRVECESGDMIIMLSDGIADSPENSAWLPEFLARPFEGTIKEYADAILSVAEKNSRTRDDMTVSVAKIRKIQ